MGDHPAADLGVLLMARNKTCSWCGEDLGVPHDREPESCGKLECNREVRMQIQEEREDAHDQLDRDMGWDR